jgi:hypothetical protein
MTRIAWFLGNWLAQIVFAFRIGYRDGSMLRPGTRPIPTHTEHEV